MNHKIIERFRAGRGQSLVKRLLPVLRNLLLGGVLCLGTPAALAGTTVSLYKSFAGNINFVTTGGTFRTADNNTDPYAVTTSSSGPLSGIPAGSTIVAAYLYYAASDTTADSTVTFNGTGVTADRTFTDTTVVPFYSGFKDVTSLVTGNGTYTVSGLTINTGSPWNTNQTVLGGWALVVIYSNNTTESNRVINVFDGFQAFQNSNITLTPNNFQIPGTGINGKFAVITWEGDPTLSGNETLQYNGNTLTDACNGTNNQYNSTINTLTCTGNAATDDVYYGVDIDTFDITSYLAASQTSGTTFYQSGQDAVMLSAQIVSVSNVPVADLSITKSHTGNFAAGSNGSYNIAVHNNGPAATSGTTTVTDTLPTGLTYVAGTGSGWSCSAAGQTVTCTDPSSIANGANANAITLTVAVAGSAANSVSNTAAVSNPTFDNVSGNNSSTDATTILHPDLSTSTKNVVDANGGDANPGDVLEYTITLTETAGVTASNVSVTDNMPAGVTSFAVTSTPGGSADSSTGGGGTNGTGYLNITGISIPANGSVTIVYNVTVAAGDAPGYSIDNTATITNPNGTGASAIAPTIIVSQSQVAASGNKILYVYDNLTLTRTPQTGAATQITVPENSSTDWILSPALTKVLVLTPGTNNVSVSLTTRRSGSTTSTARSVYVQLYKKSGATYTQIGANSGTQNFTSATWTSRIFTITVPNNGAGNLAAGDVLVLRVQNSSSGSGTRTIDVEQDTGGNRSTVTLATSTVINVDSVSVYSAAYPATATPTGNIYEPNNTVYIRAVVSDPFGSYDIDPATGGTAPKLTLTDANGAVQLTAVNMTEVADSGAATKTFEYYVTGTNGYSLPGTAAIGFWTPSVTATEGTEGTITHTANGSFDVETPVFLVMKAVSAISDPVHGTTRPKSIPGATMQYLVNVSNNGKGTSDNNSLVITDPVPANSKLLVNSVAFTDGTPSSALVVNSANVSYSSDNGATWTYTPVAGSDGTDPNVTNIRISPQGSMAGKTTGTAPSFRVTFEVIIN